MDLRSAQGTIWLAAETDAAGRFQFTGLPAGTYKLFATHAGFLEHAARRPVTLGEADRIGDAEILLPPQAVISGRVLDEEGDPVGAARLWIFRQVYQDGRKRWDRLNASTLSNEAGEYRFAGLKPGRYLVQADGQRQIINNHYGDRDRQAMYYFPTYYPNAAAERSASPVELGVGAQAGGIDIRLLKLALPPSFRLSGRVTGAPPNSEIGITLSSSDGSRFAASGMARPPGYTFTMSVRPGQYNVLAYVYSSERSAAYATARLAVTGDLSDFVLPMGPAPDLAARVTLAENAGKVNLKGVRVTLSRVPAYPGGTTAVQSDAAGRLVFPKTMPPGRYSLEVDRRTLPEGCYVQKVMLGGQELSADDFEILDSSELDIILSNAAGTIIGSVLDGDGKPYPTYAVTLIPADEKSRPLKQPAGDDGSFKLSGLRPGKYHAFAWEEVDDALWQDPEFRKPYAGRASQVTVGPAETQNVQLRLIPVEEIQ